MQNSFHKLLSKMTFLSVSGDAKAVEKEQAITTQNVIDLAKNEKRY